MSNSIGFMQGRLSPLVDGKIQAFPWDHWRHEFLVAQSLGLGIMEWTLDQNRLYENPLLTSEGRGEIDLLCDRHHLCLPSLTGDCFMQAPFWKTHGQKRANLEQDFIEIARACSLARIKIIVVPLVDNGCLVNLTQEDLIVDFMLAHANFFDELSLHITFECDLLPDEVARFIARLPGESFGINYDVGNSAALGFDPETEFAAYGGRITNVHIKDRLLGGTTVPLGAGNANFNKVFALLKRYNYGGNLIMQTARAVDGRHAEVMADYRDQIKEWILNAA